MPIDFSEDVIVRWDDPDPAHVPLLTQAGINTVLLSAPHAAFRDACSAAGMTTAALSELRFVDANGLTAASGANVVLTSGLWPGVRRPPSVNGRGDETASASREPWVDANSFWIEYLRALYPQRPALLGYLPELGDRGVPFDTLELALLEARAAGGNYILAVEPFYRTALLRQDAKALAAWKQLGITARWLHANSALFRQNCPPAITVLVESGEDTAELANLLYRRNASPALAAASDPPRPDPALRLTLVAANLRPPAPDIAKRILAHAEAGSTVITASAPEQRWWRNSALKPLRVEPDREFFSLGRGQIVAYPEPVSDPSEFALDVIDIVTHKRRPVRLWNAPAVVALVTGSPRAGERLVHLLNYGSPVNSEMQIRVQGLYSRAAMLRPDGSPLPLRAAKRGTMTEVFVPELKRLGVLVFS